LNKYFYWFYLEGYVLVFIRNTNTLLYNSLTGDIILHRNVPQVAKFLKKLKLKKNNMVLKVSKNYLEKNIEVLEFIKEVKEKFMGDLLESTVAPNTPFIMAPYFNLMKSPLRLIKAQNNRSVGENIVNYLREISIFVNNKCSLDCLICNNAYKQFLFCHKNHPYKEISCQDIKTFLSQANLRSLNRINILGGDIFKHSDLECISSTIKNIPVKKILYVHYKNIHNKDKELDLFTDESYLINLLVDPNSEIDLSIFDEVHRLLKSKKCKFIFTFPIDDELVLKKTETIIKRNRLSNSVLLPYYNGSNISFFKKYVFIKNIKMITETKATSREIFSRMVINTLNFGKIYISSDGEIYSNFNLSRIGKIGVESIIELVYKEMLTGRSWRKLRKNAYPCKICVLNLLCPPLSNYEYIIGKNNLCCIWDGPE